MSWIPGHLPKEPEELGARSVGGSKKPFSEAPKVPVLTGCFRKLGDCRFDLSGCARDDVLVGDARSSRGE